MRWCWRSLSQTLLWLVGVSLLAQCSGCAALPRDRVTQLFGSMSVPQSWRSPRPATDATAESTVAANTAGQVAELTEEVRKEADNSATPIESTEILVAPSADEPIEQAAAAVPPDETPGIVSSTMQRLRDALSSDVREAVAPIDPFSRQHPLRIRIESLLGRAQTALNDGDLDEARVAAERAVQLSETSALEYLPNEERPEEVLQRIVERIDSRDLAPSELSPDALSPPLMTTPRIPLLPELPGESFPDPQSDHELPETPATPAVVIANRPQSVELPASDEPALDAVPSSADEDVTGNEPVLPMLPEAAVVSRASSKPEQPLLTVPNDPSPAPPQVDEAEPFPQVRRLSSAPTPVASPAPPIELFIWADLWPLSILGLILVICALGLGLRSLLERRRSVTP